MQFFSKTQPKFKSPKYLPGKVLSLRRIRKILIKRKNGNTTVSYQGPIMEFVKRLGSRFAALFRGVASGCSSYFRPGMTKASEAIATVKRLLLRILDIAATQVARVHLPVISCLKQMVGMFITQLSSKCGPFVDGTKAFISRHVSAVFVALMITGVYLLSKHKTWYLVLSSLYSAYLFIQGEYVDELVFATSLRIMQVLTTQNIQNQVNVVNHLPVYQDGDLYYDARDEDEFYDCFSSPREMYTSYQEWVPQSRDAKSWIMQTVTIMSIFFFGSTGMSFDFTNESLQKLMNRHVLLQKSYHSWEWMLRNAGEWINTTYRLVAKHIFGKDIIDPQTVEEVEQLYNEAMEMVSLNNQRGLTYSLEQTMKVEQMYRKYLVYRRKYSDNRRVVELLSTILPLISALYKRVVDKNPLSAQFRKEPVCISIRGQPGVGKSYILQVLKQDLASILGREDNPEAISMYMRCAEQEYWDGYAGQQICCFDDIGQRVDSVSNPNLEFFELIRAVNIFPYMLHSAALHEKSNNVFVSDFVVLTTNLAQFRVNSIISSEALKRRIHLDVEMKVIPEVRKQGSTALDLEKLALYREMNGLPNTDLSHVQFMQILGSRRRHLNYDQFVKVIENQHQSHCQDYENRQEYAVAMEPWSTRREEVVIPHFQIDDDDYPFARRIDNRTLMRCLMDDPYELLHFERSYVDYGEFLNLSRSHQALILDMHILIGFAVGEQSDYDIVRPCVERAQNDFDAYLDDSESEWSGFSEFADRDARSEMLLHEGAYRTALSAMRFRLGRELTYEEELQVFADETIRVSGGQPPVREIEETLVQYCAYRFRCLKKVLVKNAREIILAAYAVVFVIVSAYQFYNYMWPAADYERSKSDATPKRKTRFERSKSGAEARKKDRYEGLNSENGFKIAELVRKNQYILYVWHKKDDMEARIGQVLMLKGHVGLINEHFVKRIMSVLRDDSVLEYRKPGNLQGIQQDPQEFLDSLELIERENTASDLNTFRAPSSMPLKPDILPHIATVEDLNKLGRGVKMILPTIQGQETIMRSGTISGVDVQTSVANKKGEATHFLKLVSYDCDTIAGDCGAPIIVQTDLITRRLVGIHFAGGKGRGFCQPLLREDLPSFENEDSSESTVQWQDGSSLQQLGLNGSQEYLGHIPEMIATSTKTKIEESPIHGCFEVQTGPAIIKHPFTQDGPMVNSLKKYGHSTVLLDKDILRQAVASYTDMLFDSGSALEYENRKLSTKEAVRGIQGCEYVGGVKRQKSAGYPWMFKSRKPGKTAWLGNGNDYDLESPKFAELSKAIDVLDSKYMSGVIPEIIFVDTLKDERRSLEKLAKKSTRTFSAAPMDFTILQRKYFLGFLAYMHRNRITNECAVGTNAHSKDWELIPLHLKFPEAKTMIAGDFSNFDGTLNYYILEAICDIINDFYGDGRRNARARKGIWRSLTNCVHVVGNIVYQLSHGQPSGNAATAVINSMYNSIAVRYCYGLIMGEVRSFNKNVRMIAYGDDNIISVAPIVQDKFNALSLSEAFSSFGMTYTDETKNEHTSIFRTISEVTFLKRGFSYNAKLDYWFAPLSRTSIQEMVMWVHKGPSSLEACKENIKMALFELYHYSQEEYDSFLDVVQRALNKIGESVAVVPYLEGQKRLIRGELQELYDQYLDFL